MSDHPEETGDCEAGLGGRSPSAPFVHEEQTSVPFDGGHDSLGLPDVHVLTKFLAWRRLLGRAITSQGRDSKSIGVGNCRVGPGVRRGRPRESGPAHGAAEEARDDRYGLSLVLVVALQGAATTDWKTHAPWSIGWRTVTPGMTIDDVVRALPNEVGPGKQVKYSDGTTGSETKLRRKIKIDRTDYEVSFYFNADRRFESIVFFSNKVKKETFGEVTAAFTGLRGEPTSKEEKPFPEGSKMETAWKDGDTTLRVTYATVPLGGFVTGRIVTVAMNYQRSS